MKIFVDADACPKIIKEFLYKLARKRQLQTLFFANHPLAIPRSNWCQFIQVDKGFDEADKVIVERISQGDIVITADIPLASEVIHKGATALNPRGQIYTESNIAEKLSTRHLMTGLRDSGQITGGPSPINDKDKQAFANAIDKLIAQNKSS